MLFVSPPATRKGSHVRNSAEDLLRLTARRGTHGGRRPRRSNLSSVTDADGRCRRATLAVRADRHRPRGRPGAGSASRPAGQAGARRAGGPGVVGRRVRARARPTTRRLPTDADRYGEAGRDRARAAPRRRGAHALDAGGGRPSSRYAALLTEHCAAPAGKRSRRGAPAPSRRGAGRQGADHATGSSIEPMIIGASVRHTLLLVARELGPAVGG